MSDEVNGPRKWKYGGCVLLIMECKSTWDSERIGLGSEVGKGEVGKAEVY
jgi:hypothetical protein